MVNTCGRDLCGLKYISHDCKLIFFEIPKNGSATLLSALSDQTTLERLQAPHQFQDYQNYLKCAFVRNPWDRIVSCYLNKIKKDVNFNNENFENGIMRKFMPFGVFYAGMEFKDFLKAVDKIPDEKADGHFASQYRRITMNGKIIVDFLGRFENYHNEVEKLLTKVGLQHEVKLRTINRSRDRKPYHDYYDEETINIVKRRYKEDIRLFGYQFE